MSGLFDKWRSAWRADPAFWLCIVSLLALGVFLRSYGYFDGSNGLWNDEANWVLRMARGQSGGNIRPPGYVAFNRLLIEWRPSEAVLRSSSYLAGIAALPLFVVIARRAGLARWSTAFGLFVLAVHPWAVAYAKEWKPYGFELGLHAILLALALRYFQSEKTSDLVVLAVCSGASLLFGWNTLFLFPGMFVALLLLQYRRKKRLQLALSLGAALVGALVVGVMHFKRIERLLNGGGGGGQKFWGKKYGVFYLEKGDFWGQLRWTLRETWEVAELPGRLHAGWSETGLATQVAEFTMGGLVVAGALLLLWRKNWLLLLLWVGPWLMTVVANWIHVWPYGVFRTNAYLLLYPLLLALWALSEAELLWEKRGRAPRAAFAVIPLALGLPFAPVDLEYFKYKDPETGAFSSSIGKSLSILREHEQAKKTRTVHLFLDGYACGTANYYLKLHPDFRELEPYFKKHVRIQCADNSVQRLATKIRRLGKKPSWIISARPASAAPLQEFLKGYCEIDYSADWKTPDTLTHCLPR